MMSRGSMELAQEPDVITFSLTLTLCCANHTEITRHTLGEEQKGFSPPFKGAEEEAALAVYLFHSLRRLRSLFIAAAPHNL